MALKKADRANFKTLLEAARNNDLALVQSTDAKTGEYRALLCAITVDPKTQDRIITPFGHMCTGNPYEDYTDPTMEDNNDPHP